jgi:serine protease Do
MNFLRNVPIITFVFLVLMSISISTYFHTKSYFYEENVIHPVAILTIKDTTAHGSAVHMGNGYFITVAHNILPNRHILLRIPSDENAIEATVLWADDRHDIAYLFAPELSNMGRYNISCNPLTIGEEIAIHGHPVNLTSITLWGRVAGVEIPMRARGRDNLIVVPVDARIIPGMSGGSVTNNRGQLVGINLGYQVMEMNPFTIIPTGIGYIIPSTVICRLMSV